MAAGVTVRGDAECGRAFDRLGDAAHPAPNRAAAEAAAEVVRARTPVRSGRLRSTVAVEGDDDAAFVTAGGPVAPYAGAINYGWPARDIAPARYLDASDPATGSAAMAVHRAHVAELVARFDRETPG